MVLEPLRGADALNLFVGVVLIAMACTLLVAGRRTREGLLLAAFLAVVGEGFVAVGASFSVPADPRFQLAMLTLAWDPLLLLLFATSYPYERRGAGVRGLLAGVAAAGALATVFILTRPRETYQVTVGFWFSLEHTLLIGNLLVAYGAAWLLSVRLAREAPTPQLARRAAWLVTAVGVVVVPRIGLAASDFVLGAHLLSAIPQGAALIQRGWNFPLDLVLGLPLMIGAFLVVRREAARGGSHPLLRSALRNVALIVGLLAAGGLVLAAAEVATHTAVFGASGPYALRWVVVAAILVYGVLAYEVVEFSRARAVAFPLLGGLIGATAAVLAGLLLLRGPLASEAATFGVAIALGLAASVPAAFGVRAVLHLLGPEAAGAGQQGRRLELYRAALEAAWARGLPGAEARRRLEQDRRAFGVSVDEAGALEHAVSSSLRGRRPRLQLGDEPFAGVVVERVLGEGAQGRVFIGRRHPGGARVVVKEMHHGDNDGQRARQRFLREVRALQGLRHPGIVGLLDAAVVDAHYLLLLEHVDGVPLSEVLASRRPSSREVGGWLADALRALDAAHRAGVVHRDVTPANLLVDRDGRARLTDFGVASGARDAPAQGTATGVYAVGAVAGTLAYMAPEQARGEAAGPTADLYALGLIAYEALAGRPAIDVRGHGLFDGLQRVAHARVDFRAIPPSWRPFLRKALQPDASERFSSASAMRDAIPVRPSLRQRRSRQDRGLTSPGGN